MKTIAKITTAALITSAILAGNAQAVTTKNVFVGATVIKPLALTQVTPLFFGTISSGTTAGTVDHYGYPTGGVVSQGGAKPGVFHVTGEPNTNFTITSSPTATLTKQGSTETMTATITTPAGSVLDNAGTKDFNSTGILSVAANQASGAYSGTYTVTVSY